MSKHNQQIFLELFAHDLRKLKGKLIFFKRVKLVSSSLVSLA